MAAAALLPHTFQQNAQSAGRSAAGKDHPVSGGDRRIYGGGKFPELFRPENFFCHCQDIEIHFQQIPYAIRAGAGKCFVHIPGNGIGLFCGEKTKMELGFIVQKIYGGGAGGIRDHFLFFQSAMQSAVIDAIAAVV
jgi:hypothetical protein